MIRMGATGANAGNRGVATEISSVISVASCSKMSAREPEMVRIGGQEQEQTEKTEEFATE
jgi:hypothetical protein